MVDWHRVTRSRVGGWVCSLLAAIAVTVLASGCALSHLRGADSEAWATDARPPETSDAGSVPAPFPRPPTCAAGVADIDIRVFTAPLSRPCDYGLVRGYLGAVDELSDGCGFAFEIDSCGPDSDCDESVQCRYEVRGVDPRLAGEISVNEGVELQGFASPRFLGLDLNDFRRCASCGPKPMLYARSGTPSQPTEWTSVRLAFSEGAPTSVGSDGCGYEFALLAEAGPVVRSVVLGAPVQLGDDAWSPHVELISSAASHCDDRPHFANWVAWVSAPVP